MQTMKMLSITLIDGAHRFVELCNWQTLWGCNWRRRVCFCLHHEKSSKWGRQRKSTTTTNDDNFANWSSNKTTPVVWRQFVMRHLSDSNDKDDVDWFVYRKILISRARNLPVDNFWISAFFNDTQRCGHRIFTGRTKRQQDLKSINETKRKPRERFRQLCFVCCQFSISKVENCTREKKKTNST